ncbi:unnamed protein product [Rotaria sp. Silwood2]|nr:unnamed protein product [Rotaria sp. Silwood2]
MDLVSDMFINGSFQATSFRSCCPQKDTGIYIPMQDEQCLYLNIFTSKAKFNQSLLPVLVWIHGGALQVSCSSQSIPLLYNGTNIVARSHQQPVIIVTINYRLSILGDMYLNELTQENPIVWPTDGNYFYLDMLSALRWINKIIRDYGGNSHNVLLFGESAGAKAAIDIAALRGSFNLYRHVISQSGNADNYLYYTNMSNALNASNKIVQPMKCSNRNSQQMLACLRNCSIEDLIIAYGDPIQNGKYNQILSIIMGNNDYEYPKMNSTDAISVLISSMGQKWAAIVADYFQLNNCSSNINAINRCCNVVRLVLMNKLFVCNVHRIYNNLYSKYGPQKKLFWYHINCNPGVCPQLSIEEDSGLCVHAIKILYVFGTVSSYGSISLQNCTWDNQSHIFSNQIISHWIHVVTTGKPLEPWCSYGLLTPKYFYITPYEDFSVVSWNGSCSIFNQIEQEAVSSMFGNNSPSYCKNSHIYGIFHHIIFNLYSSQLSWIMGNTSSSTDEDNSSTLPCSSGSSLRPRILIEAESLRAEAQQLMFQAKAASEQSHIEYHSGYKSEAKILSIKKTNLYRQMNEKNQQAAKLIFKHFNQDRPNNVIDLHSLYVEEALQYLEKKLDECHSNNISQLTVITGIGNNSQDKIAKIKPKVENFARQNHLKMTPYGGHVVIDLTETNHQDTNGCIIL